MLDIEMWFLWQLNKMQCKVLSITYWRSHRNRPRRIWGHKATFCTYSLICCPTCSKSPQNGSHPFLCHSQLFIILNNCIIHYGNVIYQISGIFGHWAILCASFLSNLYQKPHKSTKFIFISLMICWFYAHLTPEAIKTTSPSAHSFVTFDQ